MVIAGLRIISDKKKKAGSAWWITVTGTSGRNPISDGFTDAEECFDEHDHDSGQCSGVSVD